MKETRMHLVRVVKTESNVTQAQGLAGWILSLVREGLFLKSPKRTTRKHMRVVETLPMGPKRHLHLVSCDGERFLVGGGAESVQTIVRVRPEGTGLGLVRGGEHSL